MPTPVAKFRPGQSVWWDIGGYPFGKCDVCGKKTRRRGDVMCPSCGKAWAASLDFDGR